MSIVYVTGGRAYQIKKIKNKKTGKISGKVSRLSCKDLDNRNINKSLGKTRPNVGDKVSIIIKPYNQYNCKIGIVKNVLTKKAIHTRGHKVRLISGEIGRTVKIHSS